MKAIIAIISDGHVGAKIPGSELSRCFPFVDSIFHGICPFFMHRHPFHDLFNLIGETFEVFPEGDCESLNGVLGFPARFAHIPPVLDLFADIPRRGLVVLCPDRARRRVPATSLMHFRPPVQCRDVTVKSYRLYRGGKEFLFSGFVSKNGKSAYLLVGSDKDAPIFVGRGFKGSNSVAILVYGLSDLEKVKKELSEQFSEFHLHEASKADLENLTNASATPRIRDDTSVDRSDHTSPARNRHGS